MQIRVQRRLIRHRLTSRVGNGQRHRQRIAGTHLVCGMETHVGFILDPWHFASRQSFGIQHIPHTGTGKRPFVQRPLAQSCEPMNRSLRSLPAMHKPRPEPGEAHRHSPANRLTSFEMPCAGRPDYIRLPRRGPAQQMRPVIADYRATAVIGERAQIDAIAHKCFFFRCVSDVLHHIDDFLGTEESRAGVREPIRRAKLP